MGTVKTFVAGMAVMLALVASVAARSVPESVSTTGLEHELYVRLVCNVEGDKMLFIPGVEGEGWAYCTAAE